MMNGSNRTRIGIGADTHRLITGRDFIAGGIIIPFDKGEDAHSDGDVLIHAVIDALLGAAALGDIGELFPDTDMRYKNISSALLLKNIAELLKKKQFKIINIDSIIICEKPAILPYRDAIRRSLAAILEIEENQIFVKGKSAEKIGAIGEGLAVEARAVCLLEEINND